MNDAGELKLSKREREIMDIIFARGEATGAEVMEGLSDELSYSAVRTFLRILEQKGYVKHRKQEQRFVYYPTVSRQRASQSALSRVLRTFFGGSVQAALVALLEASDTRLSEVQLKKIQAIIDQARKDEK